MKPVQKTYTIANTTTALDIIPLNIHNPVQQLGIFVQLPTFVGSYKLQGNLGMINDNQLDVLARAGYGEVVPNPSGWFDINTAGAVGVQLGMDDLKKYLPVAFIRPVATALTTAGDLVVTILQQGVSA